MFTWWFGFRQKRLDLLQTMEQRSTASRVLTESRAVTEETLRGTLSYGYIPPDADVQTLADVGDDTDTGTFVIWKIAKLGKGSTFRKTIKRLRASNIAGVHDWGVWLVITDVPDTDLGAKHRCYSVEALHTASGCESGQS